ncbi:S16 family serine protease [Arthrobacter sp. CAU 1506]|uniref:YlbL family protein n=1 Tax=Arthrobacter sp. CAU 1506 TaxID=2560052 RepID=UPI001F0D0E48|nr:S16 family serine protease [Arthrobacter sp. CAU 1506]
MTQSTNNGTEPGMDGRAGEGAGQQPVAPRPRERRGPVMAAAAVVAVVTGVVGLALPAGYVIETPGPAINTIGEVSGTPLIEVPDHRTYKTSGALDLTTVYVEGGRNSQVNMLQVLAAWLNPQRSVAPTDLVYPPDVTQDDIQQQNAALMASSQESSIAAALTQLDVKYSQTLSVADFTPDAAAAGKLEAKDTIRTVNGRPVTGIDVLRDELNASDGAPVELGITRDGRKETVDVAPKENGDGVYQLGVMLGTEFDFPFQVKIQLDNVGGPSAGMMFALGIIDTLTEGEMTGGKHFAGTGTIDADGTVGPIGGIRQKLVGAAEAGATVFLAPEANCAEVAGHVPDGLQVVSVATLDEAVHAVTLAGEGGDTSSLPGCS